MPRFTEGRIVGINAGHGCGFVRETIGPANLRREFYFQREDLCGIDFNEQMREQLVIFEAAEGDKGPRAYNVRPLP